ncbi:hypothetical protein ACIQZO_28250 [Streptomyces sp. NPDC097617]|uniref:hypothetical protein n=1 Tax=Streptomyces sp. NPDC097617 TaxID=3366091 RepID=UPI00380ECB0C
MGAAQPGRGGGHVTTINITDAQRRLVLGRMRGTLARDDDPEVFAVLSAGHRNCLPLPQPTSHTAGAVARELARTPSDPRTATEWAENLYTSSTSLRRAFRAETGMAFSEWRTRLRLNHSLSLLEQGQLVSGRGPGGVRQYQRLHPGLPSPLRADAGRVRTELAGPVGVGRAPGVPGDAGGVPGMCPAGRSGWTGVGRAGQSTAP